MALASSSPLQGEIEVCANNQIFFLKLHTLGREESYQVFSPGNFNALLQISWSLLGWIMGFTSLECSMISFPPAVEAVEHHSDPHRSLRSITH